MGTGGLPSEGFVEEGGGRRGVSLGVGGARREGRRAGGEERTGASAEEGRERLTPAPWEGTTKALIVVDKWTRRIKGVMNNTRRLPLVLLLRGLPLFFWHLREEDMADDDASLLGDRLGPVAGCAMACLYREKVCMVVKSA